MTVNSAVLGPATPSRGSNKGAEIRAKIAANRAKRLRIAEAMKREAGVAEHTVHKEDFGGLAYIGRRIVICKAFLIDDIEQHQPPGA